MKSIEQLAREHCTNIFINSATNTIDVVEFTGEQLEALRQAIIKDFVLSLSPAASYAGNLSGKVSFNLALCNAENSLKLEQPLYSLEEWK